MNINIQIDRTQAKALLAFLQFLKGAWENDALREYERNRLEGILITAIRVNYNRSIPENAWYWQGDGTDDLKSLTCPVVIKASELNSMLEKIKNMREEIPEDDGSNNWNTGMGS